MNYNQQVTERDVRCNVLKLPRFQRQLYTAVTGALCWGWMISVSSMGEASCDSELPKPRMKRPAQSTAGMLDMQQTAAPRNPGVYVLP